jgi:hypothetical protein
MKNISIEILFGFVWFYFYLMPTFSVHSSLYMRTLSIFCLISAKRVASKLFSFIFFLFYLYHKRIFEIRFSFFS